VRLLLNGHETLVNFSAKSDVRSTLMTGARSGVIVLRAALRCQKTHLKIKRVVGGRPYSGWLKSSHWYIIADFISTNVPSGLRLYSILNFVCVCCPSASFKWWWWHPPVSCHKHTSLALVLSSVSSLYSCVACSISPRSIVGRVDVCL